MGIALDGLAPPDEEVEDLDSEDGQEAKEGLRSLFVLRSQSVLPSRAAVEAIHTSRLALLTRVPGSQSAHQAIQTAQRQHQESHWEVVCM